MVVVMKKILVCLIFITIIICLNFNYRNRKSNKVIYSNLGFNYNKDIIYYYNKYVVTNNDCFLYEKKSDLFYKVGKISKGFQLEVSEINKSFFKIKNIQGDMYVYFKDVDKISNLDNSNLRHKNYILFNQNVVTGNVTNFYNENDGLIITVEKSFELPVLIKYDDKYGVLFGNQVLYVKKSDVTIKDNINTKMFNTSGISVLNYHFIYNDNDSSCNESICVSESFFRKHLSYIKENNYFTPTMRELEMYIDGMIQLPKSVVITIDDGKYLDNVKRLLEEYKLNGTMFLITGWFNIDNFKSDYLELHSHTNDMHDVGQCPVGQGGAIQCYSEDKILKDLDISRKKLNNTTYFAYPFYEYNNYSISMLKKAGFTMAFGGEYENGYKYIVPGIDKFRLPRWVIVNNTTMNNFIGYLNLW